MQIPYYIIDAFTSRPFRGNPAAVCLLQAWLPDALLQEIAAENNLSETAFLVPEGDGWRLRWFTPTTEIDLCGHATLATAFVLARLDGTRNHFRFHTLSGELSVLRTGDRFTLDFPARTLMPLSSAPQVADILGTSVLSVTAAAGIWIAELDNERSVRNLRPDSSRLRMLDCRALCVTARGEDCDFVSRFFAPKVGIDEDPVTGSAHCGLVPYWSEKLGKSTLHALQVSPRGGELWCELRGSRVLMSGHAVHYAEGTIRLND